MLTEPVLPAPSGPPGLVPAVLPVQEYGCVPRRSCLLPTVERVIQEVAAINSNIIFVDNIDVMELLRDSTKSADAKD